MGSVRRRDGAIKVTLDREEASLIISLVSQLSAMLTDSVPMDPDDPIAALVASIDNPPPRPDGPILERLLPDAYRDDPEAAGEFRRLTNAELRASKRGALQRILDDLADAGALTAARGEVAVSLDEPAASSWLYALTDVRLALGVRLHIGEDDDAGRGIRSADSPHAAERAVYDWLTWLQDAIVTSITDEHSP